MKSINTKSLMVFTILLASIGVMPMVVNGQMKTTDDVFDLDQVDEGIFQGFQGGFGALFGQHLGYGGNILGSIFGMLFLQSLNLSAHEMLDKLEHNCDNSRLDELLHLLNMENICATI